MWNAQSALFPVSHHARRNEGACRRLPAFGINQGT